MLINTQTLKQISEYDFKQQHSNVSFPSELTYEILEAFGYAILNNIPQPEYDSWTQELSEGTPELKDDGKWYQTWILKSIVHTPEEEEERLNQLKRIKKTQIDQETSNAILYGFNYNIQEKDRFFSYDSFDQQNFADTANAAILSQLQSSQLSSIPSHIIWNSYVGEEKTLERITLTAAEFLDLYTSGALVHKAAQMEKGGQRKAQVEAAQTKEEIDAI